MKLYFLYLLIAAIAMMAHLGARKSATTETETENAPV
jgi:Na+-transporting methylmalonyl-CoA/oxaloacetate decarboxylase gamma subunit